MLRIAYVAPEEPAPRPKKKTKKQQIHQDAIEALAVKKAQDRLNAKSMFPEERKELERLKDKLSELIAAKK